jgi:3-isopropylmalate/(R)-2-methylmalate dehydratase small subunit
MDSEHEVARISGRAQYAEGYKLTIDLEKQSISDDAGVSIPFSVGEFQRYCLMEGLDDIGLTLRHESDIAAYEAKRAAADFRR